MVTAHTHRVYERYRVPQLGTQISGAERRALIANQPIPVRSCWNGVVVMDTESLYAAQALSFRGIADGLAELHLEGSECCLIHAGNPLSELKGVYMNPNVQVGYNELADEVCYLLKRTCRIFVF
jgi:hypothetical protein